MKEKNIDFDTWVLKYGVNKLSKDLKITPMAIYHWVHKIRFPGPKYLKQLLTMSKGEIKVDEMLDAYLAQVKPRKQK